MIINTIKTLRGGGLQWLQERINRRNRKRLTNNTPTLICSNCTGGFLYHWLHLRFNSPFINLYLTNDDFLTALENWELFLNTKLTEYKDSTFAYPVGISIYGIKVHFVHYHSFEEAERIWCNRIARIDNNNIGIMLTNFDGNEVILRRFEALPFIHKIAFTEKRYPYSSTFYIKGYNPRNGKNLYATQKINGMRYIDQFDYVSFINNLNRI